MKKHFILLMMAIPVLGLSSCMSIFSSTQQPITITGENGTKLYDAANNVKLAEIKEGGSTTFRLKKETFRQDCDRQEKKDIRTPRLLSNRHLMPKHCGIYYSGQDF